jgi:hypothetical protein
LGPVAQHHYQSCKKKTTKTSKVALKFTKSMVMTKK